MRQQNHTQH